MHVSDLIDVDRRSWDITKVKSTFLPHEAEVVLGIPISFRLPKDSFIWAWTTHRKFIVKSAYMVAQKWLKERNTQSETGGSSDSSKMRSIWKLIWQLNCPNKIKHFMWRACKNILPTKNWLMTRGVGSEDCCALCGQSEASGYVLWRCHYAKAIWSGTKIKLPWLQDPLNEFIDIVWETLNSHLQVDWIMFAVTAWSL